MPESRSPSTSKIAPPDEQRFRQLNDPTVMRALTHPVRLALLETLALEGPLSATEAGTLIGESPTTCSFHFRQLAKYGFVEQDSVGPGRQRHWKIAHLGMYMDNTADDPAMNVAATSLETLLRRRAFDRLQAFQEAKSSYPRAWQEAADSIQSIIFLTPEELTEVNARLFEVIDRFSERITDPGQRPRGALPVEVLTFTFPIRLSESPS